MYLLESSKGMILNSLGIMSAVIILHENKFEVVLRKELFFEIATVISLC